MGDNKKRKSSSFRKIFPFFTRKCKQKYDDIPHISKRSSHNQVYNQYYNPQSVIKDNKENVSEQTETIYENLSVPCTVAQSHTDKQSTKDSKTCFHNSDNWDKHQGINYSQKLSLQNSHDTSSSIDLSRYPDTYYHSLDKLPSNTLPADEIEIYKASQFRTNPESVGAEIKRVSTKFLISPKKEAEVRTIQPTRARSLSLNKSRLAQQPDLSQTYYVNRDVGKPYHYSAPTSPIAVGHRIPSMPLTHSPYESLKKNMLEAEEGRKSLSRMSIQSKSSAPPIEGNNYDKETARLRVEAFYWQKIKELKVQEDEYIMKQTLSNMSPSPNANTYSNCSSPSSFMMNSKSCSLPQDVRRRNNFVTSNNSIHLKAPFTRSISERRTDSFVRNISNNAEFADYYQQKRTSTPIILENKVYTKVVTPNAQREQKCENFTSHQKIISGRFSNQSMSAGCPQPPIRTSSVRSSSSTYRKKESALAGGSALYYGSESGSDAGEIKLLQKDIHKEEDWQADGRIDGGLSDGEATRSAPRSRSSRRDDPRRHTLAGNHLYLHSHHPGELNNSELEPQLQRGYLPQTLYYDDDPGVMSEVETSSTGFRRGGKQRSSLPVVRTPSKTLERPLGLVFLQYRNETKRALLPNEITSLDTVKALFVRSFPKQLTMDYLDSPLVKVYIHDSSKDMFYELEDHRAHLRDIRDRSVLRLFESKDLNGGVFPGALGVGSVRLPALAATNSSNANLEDQSTYFSEPEIDSDHIHNIHKAKTKPPAYYMGPAAPSTLPRGGTVLRAFSPAAPPVPADRGKNIPPPAHSSEGYMSSPERSSARVPYEDPYYTQFLGPPGSRPGINPVIDEESSDGVIIDDSYQMYGVNAITTAPRPMPRPPYDARLGPPVDDMQRLRVEKMERQLANLTGLVQKALQVPGSTPTPVVAPRQDFHPPRANQDAGHFASTERPPKLGRDRFQKSVSFEKSVSFSDDPPDMNSPKQHSPQHAADTKPTKPAIKSSTLPRTSSQERDRHKPAPPPKPAGLVSQPLALVPQKTYTVTVTPDFFSELHHLQKQSRDLRIETRNLRRTTLSHAMQMRQMMADTIVKIGTLAARFCEEDPESQLAREEEIYRQDMLLLENDLYELEATVERLRGQAANRLETRVNMADIERIAMVLSKSSKTVADWKLKFPVLQETMKAKLASEMEKVVRKEKMLEEEPERLELALRRCKKLTGTLVTLKRLACVQEQRLPMSDGRVSPTSSQSSTTAGPSSEEYHSESTCHVSQTNKAAGGGRVCTSRGTTDVRPENALDALLDELQTFAKPAERSGRGEGPLRRLHSYPSGSDTDASPPVRARGQHPPKPPVPERHPELLAMAARRAPPPPPPRTTSRSPLASPTSPPSPPCTDITEQNDANAQARQSLLEQRHQELLKKQKALQEQYARLQMIQRSGPTLPISAHPDLKKTGSESNLLTKMNLNLAPASISGSMTHLAGDCERKRSDSTEMPPSQDKCDSFATTNKVYETDIL
ncbi:coiled-coil domain-containing protein AGAP005037 isoform X5 [Pieris rapae]|uniref:coiled-coil domain-containing protein AGAP005037 isoform X5 n=1 Tax=Pieris rapae TaxID=64459 RepID=UPI001E281317|nr:coiled-coil domain-containing protein AGAP005037 isoform X5 [Pieris rapae]